MGYAPRHTPPCANKRTLTPCLLTQTVSLAQTGVSPPSFGRGHSQGPGASGETHGGRWGLTIELCLAHADDDDGHGEFGGLGGTWETTQEVEGGGRGRGPAERPVKRKGRSWGGVGRGGPTAEREVVREEKEQRRMETHREKHRKKRGEVGKRTPDQRNPKGQGHQRGSGVEKEGGRGRRVTGLLLRDTPSSPLPLDLHHVGQLLRGPGGRDSCGRSPCAGRPPHAGFHVPRPSTWPSWAGDWGRSPRGGLTREP